MPKKKCFYCWNKKNEKHTCVSGEQRIGIGQVSFDKTFRIQLEEWIKDYPKIKIYLFDSPVRERIKHYLLREKLSGSFAVVSYDEEPDWYDEYDSEEYDFKEIRTPMHRIGTMNMIVKNTILKKSVLPCTKYGLPYRISQKWHK